MRPPSIVVADEPFGAFDVTVTPPPAGIGHDREFRTRAAAIAYALRLGDANGWPVVDRTSIDA
ncbi:hypothetical protein EAH84_07220 [Sphingomonas oligophenolica]|uniref:Uncharacterized protein n=1 Tax=Sphingomonas oligophenolica TaxID=301154 RepID=A0A502CK49_9SPHN|nr:hypothetical protein EAH84_07220 [Sphingomonas oligophenolica]